MELVVCGMHRSGNSAIAKLVSLASGRSLLDDPEWAILKSPLEYRLDALTLGSLTSHDIVKCPRMAEVVVQIVTDFPAVRVVFMLRDPRDIWCSINEKASFRVPTRMTEYRRLGIVEKGLAGVAIAYERYIVELRRAIAVARSRVCVVPYEWFFFRRLTVTSLVCEWMKWRCGSRSVVPEARRQLGPIANRPSGDLTIRGPGRWSREMVESDVIRFEQAVSAYSQVVFGDQTRTLSKNIRSMWAASIESGDWSAFGEAVGAEVAE